MHVFCCLQWTRKLSLRTEALIKQNFPLQITEVAVSLLLLPQENTKMVYCFHSTDLQTAAWSGNDVVLCSLWDCSCSWWLTSETSCSPHRKKHPKSFYNAMLECARIKTSDAIQTAVVQGMIMAHTRNSLWCAVSNLAVSIRNANQCQNWIKPARISKQTDSSHIDELQEDKRYIFSARVSICFHKVTNKMLFRWILWMPICTDVTKM